MLKWIVSAAAGFVVGLATAMVLAERDEPTVALDDLPRPYYTVLWENDDIRVVEHLLHAGDREPMHFHPRMIGYFLESSTVRVTESDGSTADVVLTKGTISEIGPWTHEIENIGETPLHSLIVEFKTVQD